MYLEIQQMNEIIDIYKLYFRSELSLETNPLPKAFKLKKLKVEKQK